jgi:hypothetical protein
MIWTLVKIICSTIAGIVGAALGVVLGTFVMVFTTEMIEDPHRRIHLVLFVYIIFAILGALGGITWLHNEFHKDR